MSSELISRLDALDSLKALICISNLRAVAFSLPQIMSQDCQSCGACCASYRVSFYWAESDEHPNGHVPAALTTPISPYRIAMRGTDAKPVRCVALQGCIGEAVSCSIYEQRSSTCRDFNAGDERCAQARRRHGLPALPPPTLQVISSI